MVLAEFPLGRYEISVGAKLSSSSISLHRPSFALFNGLKVVKEKIFQVELLTGFPNCSSVISPLFVLYYGHLWSGSENCFKLISRLFGITSTRTRVDYSSKFTGYTPECCSLKLTAYTGCYSSGSPRWSRTNADLDFPKTPRFRPNWPVSCSSTS